MCTNCGSKKCANCGGNFTYIAYASTPNGDNFSRVRNQGGIIRCYQAIITSNTELDTNSNSYESFFYGKYNYICNSEESEEGCCGCQKFTYKIFKHLGGNVKSINSPTGVVTISTDDDLENEFNILSTNPAGTEEVWLVDNDLVDNIGNSLQNLQDYYLEFYLPVNPLVDDEKIEIRLGDGEFGTIATIDANSDLGLNKRVIRASAGLNFSASSLVFYVTASSKNISVQNIILGTSGCFSERDFTIPFGKFTIHKGEGNTEKFLEEGDTIVGLWTTDNFVIAKYFGGDVTDKANYSFALDSDFPS